MILCFSETSPGPTASQGLLGRQFQLGHCLSQAQAIPYCTNVTALTFIVLHTTLPLSGFNLVNCCPFLDFSIKVPSTKKLLCLVISIMSNFLWPHGQQPTRLLCAWDPPSKSTGMGCHALLQGIFLTQGLIPCLLHCGWILYCWPTREAQETLSDSPGLA